MNNYIKLIKNSGLFLVANMGSKVISFFMVRLYTEILSPEEYGTLDALISLTYLIVPFCTLSIQEAVLRYSMDTDKDKNTIIKNAYWVVGIGSVIVTVLSLVAIGIWDATYVVIVLGLIISEGFYNVTMQYSRGVGRVKLFAIGGIFYTVIMVSFNMVYLMYLQMGVYGYLLSIITANVITTIFYILMLRLVVKLRYAKRDNVLLNEMIRYSAPMIPNALIWWLMSVADKYLLIYYLGTAANGLYAVAQKVPTVLNMFGGIFFQAWQLSAVEAYSDEKKGEFYSNVFHFFYGALILITGAINLLIQPIYSILVAEEYYIVWKYTSFLMLSMVFSAAATFVGTYYSVLKQTKGNLKTNLMGVVVNIILNLLLIPRFGLNGAAVATFAGYFIIWCFRIYDTKKLLYINYKFKRIMVSMFLCIVQGAILALEVPCANLINGILFLLLIYNERDILLIFKSKLSGGKIWVKK